MKNLVNKLLEKPEILLLLLVFVIIILIIQTFRIFKNSRNIRKDTVKRSKAVIGGQVAEQIAPFLPDFPANPSDVRFIGKPVDYIAFSGLSEKDRIDEILLIEVKTGKSMLNQHEREIKKAVAEGRMRYVEYRIK